MTAYRVFAALAAAAAMLGAYALQGFAREEAARVARAWRERREHEEPGAMRWRRAAALAWVALLRLAATGLLLYWALLCLRESGLASRLLDLLR